MQDKRPKVGVGLLVIKGNKVLLGKRKDSHGAGEYAGTGGHLENGETLKECALREFSEEAGNDIKVKNLRFLCLVNLRKYLPKHYIDIGFVADWESGEAKVMEPDKKQSWDWFDINKLPNPLFGTIEYYIEAYQTGKTFFESKSV